MSLLFKFLKLPNQEKWFLLEAIFFLFYAKFLILVYPFRSCIKRFKPKELFDEGTDLNAAMNIKTAIARANKLAFWKNVCLVSSFAARIMLQRRSIGSVIYLGLRFEDSHKMDAHAWLMVGDICITSKGGNGYKVIFNC